MALPPTTPTSSRRAHFELGEGSEPDGEESAPATPTCSSRLPIYCADPAVSSIRRNLSFAALREIEVRQAAGSVWRKPNEERRLPQDLEQVVAHALTGGARSLLLGSALRAGVNLLVLALKFKKGVSGSLVLQALFGQDVLRFGSMLGLFSFL